MKKTIYIAAIITTAFSAQSQSVGINATGAIPHSSSILDMNTGNTYSSPNGKGILPPNVPLTGITDAVTVTSPAISLLVYNTATANIGILAVVPGYYYWNGTQWVALGGSDWHTLGNLGTTAGTNFLGTTDAQDVVFKTNSTEQIRIANTTNNVGINNATPNASAKLDITSTTQGFAMPRMTTIQRLAIVGPVEGLQVYDLNLHDYYYYNGTKWDNARTGAGTVTYFANTTAPIGYLECNGQSVLASTYPELFSAIGYSYGGGGANFNVPDLRGEFVRGWDDGKGADPSRLIGTWQSPSPLVHDDTQGVAAQNGDFSMDNVAASYSDQWPGALAGGIPNAYWSGDPVNWTVYSGTAAGGSAYGMISASRPRNVALMPCIKY